MKAIRWTLITVLTVLIMLPGTVRAAEECRPQSRLTTIVDKVMAKVPGMIREGANLYCVRIEMLNHVLVKEAPDKETDETVARLVSSVKGLGTMAVDLLVDIRKDMPEGHLLELFYRWRRRAGIKGAGPGAKGPGPGANVRMAFNPGQLQKRLGQVAAMRAQARSLVKGLHLTEDQRSKMKLSVLFFTSSVVKPAADALAEGIDLARDMMQPKIDQKACIARVGKIAESLGDMAKKALRLALTCRLQLTKEQQKSLEANIPLRLLLLR